MIISESDYCIVDVFGDGLEQAPSLVVSGCPVVFLGQFLESVQNFHEGSAVIVERFVHDARSFVCEFYRGLEFCDSLADLVELFLRHGMLTERASVGGATFSVGFAVKGLSKGRSSRAGV